ncbi:MAG: DUF711 family protein [Deltaproteobacteria bacterium]|nr:DUF711 family protein [Deltaproteobacteria bacterium]
MNIRSITIFIPSANDISSLGIFNREARAAFESEGLPVQTVRIATPPFPSMVEKPKFAVNLARDVETKIREVGIDYASLGPGTGAWIDGITDMLAATETIFASSIIAKGRTGIDLAAIRQTAAVIQRVSTISPDGFGNLRMGALCNVPPGAPFFPAAYHDGGSPAFAIATEAADLAVSAFELSQTPEKARRNLIRAIESYAEKIVSAAGALAHAHHIRFAGIDFSLAPFPREMRSIGRAIELLTGRAVGSPGTLAAAALITGAIDHAVFPGCGFCGLMLPVLEDAVLAQRAAEGVLTIGDLLHCSAVCGTGLDTIPLPGDIHEETLAGILHDVAALALRVDKPLTARLMPIQGKAAGDAINFDFPWFAGTRVMRVPGDGRKPPGGLFSSPFLHE